MRRLLITTAAAFAVLAPAASAQTSTTCTAGSFATVVGQIPLGNVAQSVPKCTTPSLTCFASACLVRGWMSIDGVGAVAGKVSLYDDESSCGGIGGCVAEVRGPVPMMSLFGQITGATCEAAGLTVAAQVRVRCSAEVLEELEDF